MPLVEVVRTIRTSAQTVATARAVCAALGKTAVICGDRAGFVVNALLFPYLNDAVKMLEASYSTADDIDHAMKLGCGYPKGPFELLDEVGLDVSSAIQRSSTWSCGSRVSPPRRCWNNWSPPATWAAGAAGASATTPVTDSPGAHRRPDDEREPLGIRWKYRRSWGCTEADAVTVPGGVMVAMVPGGADAATTLTRPATWD